MDSTYAAIVCVNAITGWYPSLDTNQIYRIITRDSSFVLWPCVDQLSAHLNSIIFDYIST
jgi:hypothetical protein